MDRNNNVCSKECQEAILSENYIDIIVEYRGDLAFYLEKYQAECYQIIDDVFAVIYIPIQEMEPYDNIFELLDVIQIPKLVGPYAREELREAGISFFHSHPFVPLRGAGVIVGLVDSGIDYTHPVFRYEDNTTKILSIWDQSIQSNNPPEGFCYGTEYTYDDINAALQSDTPFDIVPHEDQAGHGTFLAGIAAGREDRPNNFIGAAPDADIIMVKLKQAKKYLTTELSIPDTELVYQENDIMLGIKYISEKARELDQPAVIIIGLGSNQGSHSGDTNFELYLDRISTHTGLVIVIAAGNEGNTAHHYRGQLLKTDPFEEVLINIADGEEGLYIIFFSSIPDILTLAIIAPNGHVIDREEPSLLSINEYQFPLENTKVFIRYEAASTRQGANYIMVNISEPLQGIWTFRVYGEVVINGRFDVWLPREGWVKEDTQLINPDPFTTITIPGTADRPITVGAYNHVTDSLYISSSRGWTQDDDIKPDIVAPGVDSLGPLPGNKFGSRSGTSIAAAVTAGAAALLLEWAIVQEKDITMDTRKAKNWFIRGATRKKTITYPNKEWGHGQLNLLSSFQKLIGFGG